MIKPEHGVRISILGEIFIWDSHDRTTILQHLPEEYELEFCKRVAEIYVQTLVNVINSQTFYSQWIPLSSKYLGYKVSHKLSPHIWESTGFMKNHLRVLYDERNGIYVVGFERGLRHPGSNLTTLQIAKILEYGSTTIPPRPLFRPVLAYIRKNLGYYLKEFLDEKTRQKQKEIKQNQELDSTDSYQSLTPKEKAIANSRMKAYSRKRTRTGKMIIPTGNLSDINDTKIKVRPSKRYKRLGWK